jgi:small subunit ribosomal protein S4e
MVKRHLSRLNAPKSWLIKRKGIKFITRPNPGAHTLQTSMPLNLVLRDLLKVAKTTSEVNKILHAREVLVDKKARTDKKHPVGFMDVIEIPKMKVAYRMLLNKKGKFIVKEIKAAEANKKLSKIINKTILKKGQVQLNLNDGTNLIVDKDAYKANDTVVIALDKRKVEQHLPFEKGALIYITGGTKFTTLCQLKSVKTYKGLQPDNIIFKTKEGEFETRKDYALVVGKDKPVIELEE